MTFLDQIPLSILIVACLTLGLAPFTPEPHIWEKLKMLATGSLVRPVDWFDLAMHAAPFVLLAAKLARSGLRLGV
ncbi:MAG: RND transporter [Paracoccaceae bacterium]